MTDHVITPCMGGWCARREQCPNYRAGAEHGNPAERLCERGADGVIVVQATPWQTVRRDLFAQVGPE